LHLLLDILQGIGVAAAVGIRPFLPALAVGALAAANVEIHFNGTDYSFLQSAGFLLALAAAAIVLALVERRPGRNALAGRPYTLGLGVIALTLGALLFAGSLARGHYASWPGYIAGVACAAVGVAATRPLLARVRLRLDETAAPLVPLYAESSAVALAGLSVVAPPVGLLGLLLLLWLLLAERRRAGQKYAGLRILQ
jgi:hypothetical protein